MDPSSGPRPAFAHASEAEFARILDFYEVRWEYEPHVFPILWNLDGLVVESFSPDFWLPDLDLYVEMTTLKQSLVRKKNRKLRRLRELYPAIRIKLFYGRDFRALMLKYGKVALVGAMSGTPGQATPRREPIVPLELDDEAVARLELESEVGAPPPITAPAHGRRHRSTAVKASPAAAATPGAAAAPATSRAAAAPATRATPTQPDHVTPASPARRSRRRRSARRAASVQPALTTEP